MGVQHKDTTRWKALLSILMWAVVICKTGFSQELKFAHLTLDDGLSQSVVNCVTQDKKGFIWLGTDDGLNRYNGKVITVFRNKVDEPGSISGNGILCTFVDHDGTLWIGTNGAGLNRYNELDGTFSGFKHKSEDETTLSGNQVRCMFEDAQGRFWVGTDNGLNEMDRKTGKFHRLTADGGLPDERIWDIDQDSQGNLWLATYGGGLIRYHIGNSTYAQYLDTVDRSNGRSEYSNQLRQVFVDNDLIWVGSHGASLASFNPQTEEFQSYRLNSTDRPTIITSILEDNEGQLWVATNLGLNTFDRQSGLVHIYQHLEQDPFSLSNNDVRHLFQDEAGSMWIGTNTGGANIYHRTANKFTHYQRNENQTNALLNEEILSFTEDNEGNLWVGTNGGGLSRFDRIAGAFTNYPRELNHTHEKVLSLFTAADGKIWFGTWGGGLNYYDPQNEQFGTPLTRTDGDKGLCSNDVLSIRQTDDGMLWLATLRGLATYDPVSGEFGAYFKENGLSSNQLMTITFDSKGMLWIGTLDGGLNRMNVETGEIQAFLNDEQDQSSLSNNWVNCIYEDGTGCIWVGTTMGLNKFDEASLSFVHYYQEDGLPNDYIYGILGDNNGNTWISTNNGLCMFDPKAQPGEQFKIYYPQDGLQGKEFNQGAFYRSPSGELFFGGLNGFNAFYPNDIQDNKNVPKVYITSFTLFGEEVDLDTCVTDKRYIELSYRDNFFSFEFVGLDYVLPEKNKYSYKMEGLDQNWTPFSEKNFADYTSIGGGDYIFKVRAMNNDGVISEHEASILIRIKPPFYKTQWFYAICILVVLVSIFLFIRIRTQQIQKEKRQLEIKVAERTSELAEKNKDITDSITYARRIQEAILPESETISKQFKEHFILYRPKDIVSGDFYWFTEREGKRIIAAVDCTGHGVPGAFMSMIGHNLLDQIVIERGISDPAQILTELNDGVQHALKQRITDSDALDGMDLALCVFNPDNTMEYAGAFRPVWIIRSGNVDKVDGQKIPIGGSDIQVVEEFVTHKRSLQSGDCVYLFSDGYPDQFGGPDGKKFMTRRFQQVLSESQDLSMADQSKLLDKTLNEWMGRGSQIDDVLVIGIRV